jgi:hypothetical protein
MVNTVPKQENLVMVGGAHMVTLAKAAPARPLAEDRASDYDAMLHLTALLPHMQHTWGHSSSGRPARRAGRPVRGYGMSAGPNAAPLRLIISMSTARYGQSGLLSPSMRHAFAAINVLSARAGRDHWHYRLKAERRQRLRLAPDLTLPHDALVEGHK